jgi:hypothetical protein
MLQLKTGTGKVRIVEWGYRFTSAPTSPVQMELVETGLINATMASAGNVAAYNDVTGIASLTAAPSTTSTGFGVPTGEGTITASRLLAETLDTATFFSQQFPLGREPEINGGSILRIRATPTTAAATTVICYLVWEE